MAATDESTILVAEDQEHVREALAMLLRGHDYSVTLCASPNEALAAAEQQPPDLALVDMNYQRDSTSGLEGLELIQRLRELDATDAHHRSHCLGQCRSGGQCHEARGLRLHRETLAQRCPAGESAIAHPARAAASFVATCLRLRTS